MEIAWSSSNFKEILPDKISVYSESLLPELFNAAFAEQYMAYGYLIRQSEWPIVRVFKGRAYFNLSALHRLTEQCWGVDGAAVIRAMGGKIPQHILDKLLGQERPGSLVKIIRRLRALSEAVKAVVVTRAEQKGRYRHQQNVATIGNSHTVEWLDKIERSLHQALVRHLKIGLLAASVVETAISFLAKYNEAIASSEIQGVLSDVGEAQNVRQHHALMTLASKWKAVESNGCETQRIEFERSVNKYLSIYGNRCVYEMEVSQPRLSECPEKLIETIQHLARLVATNARMVGKTEKQTTRRISEFMKACGILKPVATILVAVGRWSIVERERSKAVLADKVAQVRQALIMVGENCKPDGLHDQEDIFYLRREEIRRIANGELNSVRVLVSARRSTPIDSLPDNFCTADEDGCEMQVGMVTTTTRLMGVSVSVGKAEGIARVLNKPEDAYGMVAGHIAVVRALDSGWNVLFAVAGGVVTEIGGTISHAAILLREQNVPAIFNIPNLLDIVKDGDYLEMDCSTGTVTIKDLAIV